MSAENIEKVSRLFEAPIRKGNPQAVAAAGGREELQKTNDEEIVVEQVATRAPPPVLAPRLSSIPANLRARDRHWAPCEFVWNAGRGKYDKVPKRVDNVGHNLSTKADSWWSFERAQAAYETLRLVDDVAGLGFLMTGLRDVVGIDLDKCVRADGSLEEWAREIVERSQGYAELSPSGRGVRIFVLGQYPHDQAKPIEIYAGHTARFLTVTGHRIEGCATDVMPAPEGFMEWLQEHYPKASSTAERQPVLAMPEIVSEADLPDVDDLGLAEHVRRFLVDGEAGEDGSRTLTAATAALYEAGLGDAQVLSSLLHNPHAMTVAKRHRRDDEARAIEYLWEHHCLKQRHRAGAPPEAIQDEFAPAEAPAAPLPEPVAPEPRRRAPLAPFEGPMAEIVAAILESAPVPQPRLAILATVIGMASCCGGHYRLPDGMRLNLYGLGIADTGRGKDMVRSAAEHIATECGVRVIGKPGSGQGIEDHLEPFRPVLCAIDEVAHLLEAVNGRGRAAYLGEVAANLLKLFSASSSRYLTRVLAKSKETRPSSAIPHPCLSVLGFATPSMLGQAVTIGNVDDGLLGRMLFADGDDHARRRRVPGGLNLPDQAAKVLERIKLATVFSEDNRELADRMTIVIDPSADDLLETLLERFEDEHRDAEFAFAKSLLARSFEKAQRVAGVLAVWDNPESPRLERRHVEWAAAFVESSDATALAFVTEHMHGGQVQADAALTLAVLRRLLNRELKVSRANEVKALGKGIVTTSALLRPTKLDARRFREAIDHLVTLGEVEKAKLDEKTTGYKLAGSL